MRARVPFVRVVLFVLALVLGAVGGRAERLPLSQLSTEDGLGHENVRCAVRDARGLLWFCTATGVARFDGREFRRFGVDDGLPSGAAHDLLETVGGTLLVATDRGLFELPPGPPATPAFAPLPLRSAGSGEVREPAIHALAQSAGGVFAGSEVGLLRLEREGADGLVAAASGLQRDRDVRSLIADGEGGLWVGGGTLARRLADGTELAMELPAGSGLVRALILDSEGTLWVGSDGGVWRLRRARWPELDRSAARGDFEPLPELAGWRVRSIFRDAEGGWWVGAVGALHAFDGRRWRRYTGEHGLPDETVNALVEDGAGNLWLATDAAGVVRLTRGGLVTYRAEDGLGHPSVSALVEGEEGSLVAVGEVGAFLSRFDGERFVSVRPRLPPPLADRLRRSKTRALRDSAGEWWIASVEGLIRYPAVATLERLAAVAPRAIYGAADGLTADVVYLLHEALGGDLWIGTAAGAAGALSRWQRSSSSFETFGESAGLPPAGAPTALLDTPRGLWVGWSDGQLLRRVGGRFVAAALPTRAAVTDLMLDPEERLWVATAGDGLLVADDAEAVGGGFQAVGTDRGLARLDARCLVADVHGRVYVGTVAGVVRLDPGSGSVRWFSTADGLAQLETTVAHRDRQGALWFGTYGGVSRLVVRADEDADPPSVWIEGVIVDDRPRAVDPRGARTVEPARLGPGRHRLRIDFFAPAFVAGRGVDYQYRLDSDAEGDWSTPTPQRSVVLADLGAGEHRFAVRAVTARGGAGQPAQLIVDVAPPFWQRMWFLVLLVSVVAAALVAVHRARLRSVLALERVRTRIAADLHDDLGAGLSRISFLAAVARRSDAGDDALDQIGDTARGLSGRAREIVWSLDPRFDDLASFVVRLRETAAELLDPLRIPWSLEALEDGMARRVRLRPEQRQHLLLIFKESLHNAAKHAGATRVTLDLRVDDGWLWGAIVDDGRGIDDLEAAGRRGRGLANLRHRAAALGGEVRISGGPGTRVELRVPLTGEARRGRRETHGGSSASS